jgi:Fe-S protein assembly chaperone HscA
MQIQLKVKGQVTDIVAGIDLGTTNTLVAQVIDGDPKVLSDRQGRTIVPSVVSIDEEHHATVGDEAKARALTNPSGTITSVKRFMGRGLEDIDDMGRLPYRIVQSGMGKQVAVRVHGKEYLPQELSAMILGEAKKRVERAYNGRLKRAVITVPAYFDDGQRQATRDAGRMAGIDVLRIINEPTAAALAYGLDKDATGTILVYDLGGGTFDVSLLRVTEGVFKVLATTGNTRLGGDDFDYAVSELLLDGLTTEQRAQVDGDPGRLAAVKIAAEGAKIALTDNESTDVSLTFNSIGLAITRTITRAEFEAAVMPLIDRTMKAIEFVLDESDLDPEDVGEIVCVGGSSRIPAVRARLEEAFGKPPHTEINPDEVVALGAAVQAAILAGHRKADGAVVLDVTPLSLGIETYGGGSNKLLWRNTPIPVRATEGYSTQVDNQTAVDIHVVQGEREMAKDLRSLGRFKLRGIPPMSAGMPRILVEFFVDSNGMLKVSAKEMTSGIEAAIEVRPTYGLTDEQVEDMIFDSIEHAEEDITAHLVADLKAEAEGVLRYTDRALLNRTDLIPPPLAIQIRAAIEGLKAAMTTDDKETLEAAMEVLNESTAPVASAMMNEVLSVTVAGKTLDEVMGGRPLTTARDIRLS